ncbi:MAG: ABC transporter ATP-binding protein [Anaerolineae bacterium]|nr:ABC transporter ATP-binding protein [Anaerolineae bacterium]
MIQSPYVHVQQLSAKYTSPKGDLETLENITISISKGEFVCVLGPSGCGKSTLLRVIAGLLQPTTGTVTINGKEHRHPGLEIGMVFQHANLLPWRTVKENIALPLELAHRPAAEIDTLTQNLIHKVGLTHFEHEYPRNLSGGMAQRTAIARVLAQNPDIMLLDEPFGQLDAITREWMGIELLTLWEQDKRTVLMVTHDVEEAALLADRVIILTPRPGQIASILPITLKRPRYQMRRSSPDLQTVAQQLRDLLGYGSAR